MKRIEITISPTGDAKVKTEGFAGADCLKATRFIEATLGKTTAEKFTPEFFHRIERATEAVQIGNR